MTEPCPQVKVDRATEDDLGQALVAVGGIFWALDKIVCENVADEITHEKDRMEAIASLIMAGELLVREVTNRH